LVVELGIPCVVLVLLFVSSSPRLLPVLVAAPLLLVAIVTVLVTIAGSAGRAAASSAHDDSVSSVRVWALSWARGVAALVLLPRRRWQFGLHERWEMQIFLLEMNNEFVGRGAVTEDT
jgi:hypothetical protein